jgi:hypothetical protein
VKYKHTEGTPFDEKANYGNKFFYTVRDAALPPPSDDDVNELNRTVFTRKKTHVFNFTPAESGKKMYFRMAYENSKGVAGSLSQMFSATIP